MAGFLFRLETREGVPADPPTVSVAVPNWAPGHMIHLGTGRFAWLAPETTRPTNRPC
jgi:hypothetical protein